MARLVEHVLQQGRLTVDRAAGIIHGARILGLESANNRSYLREAVSHALRRGLYEGRQVNIDHPARAGDQTHVAARFGWLERVQQEADGGLRGSLGYLKSHPLAEMVCEVAERRPQLLGLSHNADGRTRREGGREIVESIDTVHSVDLVADPATVAGLNEAIRKGTWTMKKLTLRRLAEKLRRRRPAAARLLREAAEAGILSPDTQMDDAGGYGPGDDGTDDFASDNDADTALKQGIKAAWAALFDDPNLDSAGKIARAKDLLATLDKLLPGGKATADTDADDMEEARRRSGFGRLAEGSRSGLQRAYGTAGRAALLEGRGQDDDARRGRIVDFLRNGR